MIAYPQPQPLSQCSDSTCTARSQQSHARSVLPFSWLFKRAFRIKGIKPNTMQFKSPVHTLKRNTVCPSDSRVKVVRRTRREVRRRRRRQTRIPEDVLLNWKAPSFASPFQISGYIISDR